MWQGQTGGRRLPPIQVMMTLKGSESGTADEAVDWYLILNYFNSMVLIARVTESRHPECSILEMKLEVRYLATPPCSRGCAASHDVR